MVPAGGGYSASSSAKSGDAQGGHIGGSTFNTGYFGRGMDLEKLAVPLTAVAIVVLIWMATKKRR
jgi:hypothetical protein